MNTNNQSLTGLFRFHYVEEDVYGHIVSLLDAFRLAQANNADRGFFYRFSESDKKVICDFITQMDTAYIHPRRNSMHLSLLQSRYWWFRRPSHRQIAAMSKHTL